MKRFVGVMILLVGMQWLAGCSTAEVEGRKITAAKDLDDRFVESFNRGVVEGVMVHYWNSPELVVISPDGTVSRGWDATQDMYAKTFAEMPGARLEITDAHYRVAGDVVYGWGAWKMTAPMGKGPAQELRGSYSQVDAYRDGKLVYILDHPSLAMPAGAGAAAPGR